MEKIDYELFDNLVDRFLRHQMAAEEETEFKSLLAGNDELRQRARSIAITIREMNTIQMQRDAELVKGVKGMSEKEFRKVAGLPAKRIRFMPIFTKLAVAACFTGLVFFGINRYMGYQNTIELGNSSYLAYASDLSEYGGSRGDSDLAMIKQLEGLFLQVKDGKSLETTLATLEDLYAKAHDEDSDYYEFIDDIAWNLAIAYLKIGERNKPLPLLKEMLKRNEDYPDIAEPVQKLINDIKDL